MEYTVKALAELAGLTPRTLRWYDSLGLLKPCRVTEAGYRVYGKAEVDRLQQILFYRELGLELADIGRILDDPKFDPAEALRGHLAALEARRTRLEALILTVQHTLKEGQTMSDKAKFEGFKEKTLQENEKKYGDEIRRKYGDDAVAASNKRFQNLTEEQFAEMNTIADQIRARLAAAVEQGLDPAGEEGLAIAALHHSWLAFTWPSYAPEAHAGLGEMYVADERFTAYYDAETPGCAEFLRGAIQAYVETL